MLNPISPNILPEFKEDCLFDWVSTSASESNPKALGETIHHFVVDAGFELREGSLRGFANFSCNNCP